MNITERIKRVIAEQLGTVAEDLKPDTHFVNDLGTDSLDNVELVMALEDEFEIEIDDHEAEKILTVQQAIDYITAKVPA